MEVEREIKCFEDIGMHDLSGPLPDFNIPALSRYAIAKGIHPADMTDEERNQFRTDRKDKYREVESIGSSTKINGISSKENKYVAQRE